MSNIWVLTEEYNLYDQQGEYYIAVFKEKPDGEKLKEVFTKLKLFHNEELIKHILNGGGREKKEDQWYNLKEDELF